MMQMDMGTGQSPTPRLCMPYLPPSKTRSFIVVQVYLAPREHAKRFIILQGSKITIQSNISVILGTDLGQHHVRSWGPQRLRLKPGCHWNAGHIIKPTCARFAIFGPMFLASSCCIAFQLQTDDSRPHHYRVTSHLLPNLRRSEGLMGCGCCHAGQILGPHAYSY